MSALRKILKHKLEPLQKPKQSASTTSSDSNVTGNFYHGLVNGLAISMVLWGFVILGICWVVM